MRRRRALAVVFALAACVAHTGARAPRASSSSSDNDYPTVLTSPAAWPHDFVWRQKLVATYRGETHAFEAVVQKRGDALLLLGLTPFGTKAFALKQDGLAVSFASFIPLKFPFPPRYILNDVARTYFQDPGVVQPDGTVTFERNGERIVEQWQGGRLLQRRYRRLDGRPSGEISIVYRGGLVEGRSPEQVELDNGWLGYHLSISTLAEEAL